MFDFYISYNSSSNEAKEESLKIISELGSKGNYVGGDSNKKARLLEAEYLIVIFSSEEDFTNVALAEEYSFYLDEIKWKRKKSGSVILYVPTNISFSRIPFRLKNCYYFNYGEAKSLTQYIVESEKTIKTDVVVARPVTSSKEIKYIPHPQEVTQIIFSARAPSVDSFDGTINYDSRETGGCKDNHTYPNKNAEKNYIIDELERPTITSKTSSNAIKPPKRKNASCGCVVSIFVAVILIAVTILIVVNFTQNLNSLININTPAATICQQSNIFSKINCFLFGWGGENNLLLKIYLG